MGRRPNCATQVCTSALLAAGLCVLGGCQALGAFAYKFSRTPEVPAHYSPAKQPLLVLVQKSNNPGDVPIEADQIGHLIAGQLQEQNVAPLADPSPVADLRSRAPERYRALSPAEAGRLARAKQVLYVDLIDFTIEDAVATELVRGRIEARVRIVDSDTGQTLWPLDTTQGFPLAVAAPYARTGADQSAKGLRDKMCHDLSDKIAKLFYKYRSEEEGGTDMSRAE